MCRRAAEGVTDPELPMLTLAELGVLRAVVVLPSGRVRVDITPTYTGCPATETIRDDLAAGIRAHGYKDVEIRTLLDPPWSTEWITESGRTKLREHGISPPGPRPAPPGPVPLPLPGLRHRPACPRCASTDTAETSRFGATACKSLWRCRSCQEPFEHFKEI
ncbi:1,2-phenylacetyl-CoA epoxidase subunit PaaD [Streptomyces sp. NPDC004542]|uniref:1,2-phenylacetyl-CoA epoxidase subunit PaaD n=1 Tax=Streptomyces sp. NPDC004542 TaxID=3154281 RepID=UPI0033A4A791